METSGPVTVVVIGRLGIAALPGVQVLAHADDPRRAPRLVDDARPQVVLAGLGRDRDTVLAVVPDLREAGARHAGARGRRRGRAAIRRRTCWPRCTPARAATSSLPTTAEALADAVRRAAAGEAVFSPGLAEVVLEEYGRPADPAQVRLTAAGGRRAAAWWWTG